VYLDRLSNRIDRQHFTLRTCRLCRSSARSAILVSFASSNTSIRDRNEGIVHSLISHVDDLRWILSYSTSSICAPSRHPAALSTLYDTITYTIGYITHQS
jgi:hypothetical protein